MNYSNYSKEIFGTERSLQGQRHAQRGPGITSPVRASVSRHNSFTEYQCRLGEKEDDTEDRLLPSVSYLQKLGPEHLQLIFDTAQWLFAENSDVAFEV